jgi:hypothetical protein
MPAIGRGPVNPPRLKKMTNRSLIGTIVFLHLVALPFVLIAIGQIRLNPGRLSSYAALGPVIIILVCAYTDYLGELLRRRRNKE